MTSCNWDRSCSCNDPGAAYIVAGSKPAGLSYLDNKKLLEAAELRVPLTRKPGSMGIRVLEPLLPVSWTAPWLQAIPKPCHCWHCSLQRAAEPPLLCSQQAVFAAPGQAPCHGQSILTSSKLLRNLIGRAFTCTHSEGLGVLRMWLLKWIHIFCSTGMQPL